MLHAVIGITSLLFFILFTAFVVSKAARVGGATAKVALKIFGLLPLVPILLGTLVFRSVNEQTGSAGGLDR